MFFHFSSNSSKNQLNRNFPPGYQVQLPGPNVATPRPGGKGSTCQTLRLGIKFQPKKVRFWWVFWGTHFTPDWRIPGFFRNRVVDLISIHSEILLWKRDPDDFSNIEQRWVPMSIAQFSGCHGQCRSHIMQGWINSLYWGRPFPPLVGNPYNGSWYIYKTLLNCVDEFIPSGKPMGV